MTTVTAELDSDGLFDTHCHLFERGFHGRYGRLLNGHGEELAAYEKFRAEYSVARSLVIGYEGEERYRGNNDYIAALAEGRPWLVPVGFRAVGAGSELRGAVSLYLPDEASAASAAVALERADAAGSPPAIVSLNAGPDAVRLLADTVRRLDSTWFLFSHLGLPGPVSSAVEARERLAPLLSLAGLPQVSVKLSGQYAASLGRHPHADVQVIVDVIAEAFGTAALVWGSDFSPCLEYVSLDEAIHCLLPEGLGAQERRDILFGNATRMMDQYGAAA